MKKLLILLSVLFLAVPMPAQDHGRRDSTPDKKEVRHRTDDEKVDNSARARYEKTVAALKKALRNGRITQKQFDQKVRDLRQKIGESRKREGHNDQEINAYRKRIDELERRVKKLEKQLAEHLKKTRSYTK